MALKIQGKMKVKTLKADFKEEFGLSLRVYDGKSFADVESTLASIRKSENKGGELTPKRNMLVGNLEDKLMELFGIKTQISGSNDAYLCNDNLTLASALEEDAKKLARKAKKAEKKNSDDTDDSNGEETLTGTFTIKDLRLFKVPEEDVSSDFLDYIVSGVRIIILMDQKPSSDYYFWDGLTEKLVLGNGIGSIVEDRFEDVPELEWDSMELIKGLFVCAEEQDEDGLYDFVEENGGEVTFGEEMDEAEGHESRIGIIGSIAENVTLTIKGNNVTLEDYKSETTLSKKLDWKPSEDYKAETTLGEMLGWYPDHETETYSVIWED